MKNPVAEVFYPPPSSKLAATGRSARSGKPGGESTKAAQFLRRFFGSLLIFAGADKFFGFAVPWQMYLLPMLRGPERPGLLLIALGLAELALGIMVMRRVKMAPVVLVFWLSAAAVNFFALHWNGMGISLCALVVGAESYARLALMRRRSAMKAPRLKIFPQNLLFVQNAPPSPFFERAGRGAPVHHS